MRILLFGRIGQIGWELHRLLPALGEVTAPEEAESDFRYPERLEALIAAAAPDVIVNAAAYTAVDRAEEEPELAAAVNATGPGVIAAAAARSGALLVHYSTDFVFDGTKGAPYTESDTPAPLNVYGRTKLAGDLAVTASGARHLIFRVSWIYGCRGGNFLLTMQRLAAGNRELRVVDDQVGCPTWCRSVAEGTVDVLSQVVGDAPRRAADAVSGVYNMVCGGETSWYGFARAILPPDVSVTPVGSDAYPTPATRPAYSVLDCGRLRATFGLSLPRWQDALRMCLT